MKIKDWVRCPVCSEYQVLCYKKQKEELLKEINRVKTALRKTNSWKLKKDYGKYLSRMNKELSYCKEQIRRGKK